MVDAALARRQSDEDFDDDDDGQRGSLIMSRASRTMLTIMIRSKR